MTSLIGSLTNFSGEPKDEGPTPPRFMTRGDPELLLGESGGALPAGNIEGNALVAVAFPLLELPGVFKGTPAFASLINDLT